MKLTTILTGTLCLFAAAASSTANAALEPAEHHPAVAPEELTPGAFFLEVEGQSLPFAASQVTFSRIAGTDMVEVDIDGISNVYHGDIWVHTEDSDDEVAVQNSTSVTITELPGGGSRTDIDHGDGASTTVIHDPAAGNGSSRTSTSTTDSSGNTTTTTTTTNSNGDSTTTTTKSKKK